MTSFVAALLALPVTAGQAADKLVTDTHEITIEVRCAEGVVACDNVRYTGVNRKTGQVIKLKGRDMHTRCADGVTPCRFLGHTFRSGRRTYLVWENGVLEVRDGARVLLREDGRWEGQ